MREPLFWCVWCENGGSPTVKHEHYSQAKNEATRLARMNPGRRFVVLAAVTGYCKTDVVETRFDGPQGYDEMDREIPF